ncbi:hypothetical protein COLU111180_01165 [Cohnella lubricantis]|uniref:DUF2264 domain-containing protein n=1 Tax=Cohnella lubricantis TaxID=2163172 RepID=A0A841TC43_9BACL|nr:hypothetical protein [Cohnella lubricantis]MBB6679043.1 hypothetical protein [Cohnella lubricantis]MBP2120248.1 hypothetical protein [Cohnella lubricantis]
MTTYEQRQREIIRRIAIKAQKQPLLGSGLWFHHDIRDNFYYAAYLFAASVDPDLSVPFDKELTLASSSQMLLKVLKLQDRDPDSPTYGHWPLGLGPVPKEAKPNTLPVELMGSLMVYFYRDHQEHMSQPLQAAFENAFEHMYKSRFYAKEIREFNHHEAKYTAAKLIFGQMFRDYELVEDGHRSLVRTLRHIRENGMREYGALPWFWHWVQAFTAAWELVEDVDINRDLSDMLDYLWHERSLYYLRGAWAGPHARSLPHDAPKDGNVLFDYVQFGDFPLPDEMPRTEFAGFLYYEAPEDVSRNALDRSIPLEAARYAVLGGGAAGEESRRIHKYVYITEDYAAGGAWERVREYDNEQHRWDVTLPIGRGQSINQLYFFHPGEGYAELDPRHESDIGEVLFRKNVVIALYPLPEGEESRIVGVLPKGEWIREPNALFGFVDRVYLAVRLLRPCQVEELADRDAAESRGGPNGVVVEAIGRADAERLCIGSLQEFAAVMREREPEFAADATRAFYRSLAADEELELSRGTDGGYQASVNGEAVSFARYEV